MTSDNNILSQEIESAREKTREISNILNNFFHPQSSAMLSLNIDPLKYLSGDYRELQNFTDLVDKIHPILLRYDALGQSIFSDYIKSKLRGRAREVIEINAHVTSWPEIKATLINNFGDRLTAAELFDELRAVKFRTNSVEFYNELKGVLRRLNIKTKLDIEDDELASHNIESNKISALTIFKNKLPEPMRSLLYCRDPDSLETGMNILHECGYAYFNPFQSRVQNNIQNNNRTETRNRSRNNGNNYQTPRPHYNSLTHNQQPRVPLPRNNPPPRPPYVNEYSRRENYFPRQFPQNNNNFNGRYNNNHNNSYNHRNSPFGNAQNPYSSNNRAHNNYDNQNNGPNRPEPMEVDLVHRDNSEENSSQPRNFQSLASTTTYPI